MQPDYSFLAPVSGRYIGEVQMRGCRPVIIDKDGNEIEPESEAVAELVRRTAQRMNRENREAN